MAGIEIRLEANASRLESKGDLKGGPLLIEAKIKAGRAELFPLGDNLKIQF